MAVDAIEIEELLGSPLAWIIAGFFLGLEFKNRGFGFDLGENSAIRWRCLDGSSIGSHLIGFLKSLSGSMVC